MEEKKASWNKYTLWSLSGFRHTFSNVLGRKFRKGFTLVELLIAVAIIGILASSVFFILNPGEQLAKSRDAQRKSDLEQIKNALDAYYSDNNVFPSAISGKISGINWGESWDSYMSKIPRDPVSSQDYLYEAAGDGSWYRLYAKLEKCADSKSNPGIDCLREYSYSVNSSNLAALALIPTPTFVPPTPTLVPTSTPTPVPIPTSTPTPTPIIPKRIFLSSGTYNGNLGELSGADSKCQALANSALLKGTWKAWLSSGSISASSRLTHATVPYRLVDGTLIANNWSDLTDGSIANVINKNQNGTSMPSSMVWTNTNTNGNVYGSSDCSNWSSSNFRYQGWVGLSSNRSFSWTTYGSITCHALRSLYCFEQ